MAIKFSCPTCQAPVVTEDTNDVFTCTGCNSAFRLVDKDGKRVVRRATAPVAEPPASPPEPPTKRSSRPAFNVSGLFANKLVVFGGLGVLVLVALGVAAFFFLKPAAPDGVVPTASVVAQTTPTEVAADPSVEPTSEVIQTTEPVSTPPSDPTPAGNPIDLTPPAFAATFKMDQPVQVGNLTLGVLSTKTEVLPALGNDRQILWVDVIAINTGDLTVDLNDTLIYLQDAKGNTYLPYDNAAVPVVEKNAQNTPLIGRMNGGEYVRGTLAFNVYAEMTNFPLHLVVSPSNLNNPAASVAITLENGIIIETLNPSLKPAPFAVAESMILKERDSGPFKYRADGFNLVPTMELADGKIISADPQTQFAVVTMNISNLDIGKAVHFDPSTISLTLDNGRRYRWSAEYSKMINGGKDIPTLVNPYEGFTYAMVFVIPASDQGTAQAWLAVEPVSEMVRVYLSPTAILPQPTDPALTPVP